MSADLKWVGEDLPASQPWHGDLLSPRLSGSLCLFSVCFPQVSRCFPLNLHLSLSVPLSLPPFLSVSVLVTLLIFTHFSGSLFGSRTLVSTSIALAEEVTQFLMVNTG